MPCIFDELPPVKLPVVHTDNHWLVANIVADEALCWRVTVVGRHFVLDGVTPISDGLMRMYVRRCVDGQGIGGIARMLKLILAHPSSRKDWVRVKTAALAAFGGK
jgi:hypothetical protein